MAGLLPAAAVAWAMATLPCPFVIVGFPRSRTAWLARFLTHDGVVCEHEPSATFKSQDDLARFLRRSGRFGASDSGLTLLWRDILYLRPDTKIVAVHRDRADVEASLAHIGLIAHPVPAVLDKIETELAFLKVMPNVLNVAYLDLNQEATCKRIFEHCLGQPFDRAHWRALKDENIQCDIASIKARADPAAFRAVFGPALGDF